MALSLFLTTVTFSQRKCGSDNYQDLNLKRYIGAENRTNILSEFAKDLTSLGKYNQEITIPVVVHIVYKTEAQNIPDSEVLNQLKILNDDFSGTNADLANVPSPFKTVIAGNSKIKFVLEKVFHIKTDKNSFSQYRDEIKFTAYGGHDMGQYTSNRYLNIWVGNIYQSVPNDLAGYGTFPATTAATIDGVVIHYNVFGTAGNDIHLNKGRTASHEVGHWLGLYHIWGNNSNLDDCGDDEISDTPQQKSPNYGCPDYPKESKCKYHNASGEMFMNYMDYVDDSCMIMFTIKQIERMRANFIPGGPRADIISANPINLSNVIGEVQRKSFSAPVISKYDKELLSWNPVAGAVNYTISLKSLSDDKTVNITTNKLSLAVDGLDHNTLYEVDVTANKADKTKSVSNPLLLKDEEIKQKISLTPKQ